MTDDNHDGPDTEIEQDPDQVLALLEASASRRIMGVAVLALLAFFLLYLAVLYPPSSMLGRIFLIAFGAFALFGCIRLWQCTAITLELTSTQLREVGGRVLAEVSDVRSVSRGAFAFKPSNGFSLGLARPGGFVWAPGLWWRIGRRVGVGGVTAQQPARFMAETITAMIQPAD